MLMSRFIASSSLKTKSINFTRSLSSVAKTQYVPHRFSKSKASNQNKTALLFPGQGAQFVGMGRDFYDQYACAREVVDEVDETLGFKLSNIMFEGDQNTLKQTENAQPAILATSICALRVLQKEFDFDIKNEANYALGHSLGEYTALVAAESLSLSDAARIVHSRGLAMQNCIKTLDKKTVMCALLLNKSSLQELLDAMNLVKQVLPPGEVAELANVNSSLQIVLSGTVAGVDEASRFLLEKRIAIRAIDLPVSAPFHCSLMTPARNSIEESLCGVQFKAPIIPVVMNATSLPLNPDVADPTETIRYSILQQVDHAVPWFDSIKFCKASGVNQFLTFGPNKILGNLIRKDYPLDWVRYASSANDCRKAFTAKSALSAEVPLAPNNLMALQL